MKSIGDITAEIKEAWQRHEMFSYVELAKDWDILANALAEQLAMRRKAEFEKEHVITTDMTTNWKSRCRVCGRANKFDAKHFKTDAQWLEHVIEKELK